MSKRENIERENDGDSKRLKIEEMEEVGDDKSMLNIIPKEQIEEILRRVGDPSSVYLVMGRMSCKSFNVISQVESVLKSVNCEDFFESFCYDNDGANYFFDLCIDKGNPTALFENIVLLFETGNNLKEGIQHLEKASKEGHDITTYLIGLQLACHQGPDHERQRGMILIRNLKASIGNKILDYRRQLVYLKYQRGDWYHDRNHYMPIQMITDHHNYKCKDLLYNWDSIMIHIDKYFYECFEIDIDKEYCEACVWELESKFFAFIY